LRDFNFCWVLDLSLFSFWRPVLRRRALFRRGTHRQAISIGKPFLMAPANEKQQAHQLLDQLDAGQLAAVVHLLQVMTGRLSHSLASAPVEEEELTSETAAALDRARASLARGEGIPHDDILREFGLGK
jgi:hypothetical protein